MKNGFAGALADGIAIEERKGKPLNVMFVGLAAKALSAFFSHFFLDFCGLKKGGVVVCFLCLLTSSED
jgi:hypothetical protein